MKAIVLKGDFGAASSAGAKRFERPHAGFHKGSEVADYTADDVGIAEDDAEFEVDRQRLVGEIGAAEQGDPFVGSDQLGVEGCPGSSNYCAPVFRPSPECDVLPVHRMSRWPVADDCSLRAMPGLRVQSVQVPSEVI